jgi:RNA polymerase sigma-70 factor, ECF subfamily
VGAALRNDDKSSESARSGNPDGPGGLNTGVSITALHMTDATKALENGAVTSGSLALTEGEPEQALIEAAGRDPEAFGRLYRTHYHAVAGYLLRRTGDAHVAEDLAGETFLAAMNAIGRYRQTGVPIAAWFLRIATNKANRWAKKNARASGLRRILAERAAPPAASRSEPGGTSTDEAADRVRAALNTLSPDHQTVLALRHIEHLTIEQVSLVLGIREGTVKSRLARARAALLAAMDTEGAAS